MLFQVVFSNCDKSQPSRLPVPTVATEPVPLPPLRMHPKRNPRYGLYSLWNLLAGGTTMSYFSARGWSALTPRLFQR